MTIQSSTLRRLQRAFTLVELITAMAITAILVVIIMQLTNQSIDLWKSMRQDTGTSVAARTALQTICRDLESIQIRNQARGYQWMYAEVDSAMRGMPIPIPRSARCIFYSCPPDRNPAVSSTPSLRSSYRSMLAAEPDAQGDVSIISYRLKFRDHILNLPARKGDTESFPLFSLYRRVVSPRDTYEHVLGTDDLKSRYSQFEAQENESFLCENIVELSLVFNIEYVDRSGSSNDNESEYTTIAVPILSSSAGSGKRNFRLYSDYADTGGERLRNARVVSAEVSITVLTEEGVALAEQVRLGQRRAPKLESFFSQYTRSFSRSVSLPVPL